MHLRKILEERIPEWRSQVDNLLREHSHWKVSEINLGQLYRGLRDVKALVCDTSMVDPREGLFIRDIHISKLVDRLPEEIFFLLCSGKLPAPEETQSLQAEIRKRMSLSEQVWRVMDAIPANIPPMSVLSMILTYMSSFSHFRLQYSAGMKREDHWRAMFEDALDILAKVPVIAAGIFRKRIRNRPLIPPDAQLDWGANFARMLGLAPGDAEFERLVRLFMVLHSDHEGGSVSVNATRVVNSALSDSYLSISAGMNGLAGPLHGMANQTSVRFALSILDEFETVPPDDQLSEYLRELVENGVVMPGFGHAVLRNTDPRFTAFFNFGKQVCPEDPVFLITEKMARLVPPLLSKHTQISNPHPNIDLISGVLLHHFGMRELEFYPVMFGVSLLLGMNAQLILNRALLSPIFRPRSVTTRWIQQQVSGEKE